MDWLLASSFLLTAITKVHTYPVGAGVFLLCQVPTVVWQSSSEAAPCDIPMSYHSPLCVAHPSTPTSQQANTPACFPPKHLQHHPPCALAPTWSVSHVTPSLLAFRQALLLCLSTCQAFLHSPALSYLLMHTYQPSCSTHPPLKPSSTLNTLMLPHPLPLSLSRLILHTPLLQLSFLLMLL